MPPLRVIFTYVFILRCRRVSFCFARSDGSGSHRIARQTNILVMWMELLLTAQTLCCRRAQNDPLQPALWTLSCNQKAAKALLARLTRADAALMEPLLVVVTVPGRWARAHAELDIRGEDGALAKRTQKRDGSYFRTALCGEAMEAEGDHYAEFTLVATEHGAGMVGVARPTYDPARGDGKGVWHTADGWMLGCGDGNHYHAGSRKDWASGGPLAVAAGETVGLLLSRGRLSVYRDGSAVGVLCEGLSGSFVWAADLHNQGEAVRILRRPVPQ